ncbi:DNA-3-methyladenine glycosylase family protein [Marinicella sp. W31]|uniref:DNA-3-methyladenine glycosylase family protein n=1 Tax=Marinicella sp. W31 TaxID=3023713 RepID=UPI003757A616
MNQSNITIPVVAPFAWDVMLEYLQSRLIADQEYIKNGCYYRQHLNTWLNISFDAKQQVLMIHHDAHLVDHNDLIKRCQQLFAPEQETTAIYHHLTQHLPIPSDFIGFRPLGSWDRFELCIRTIIGQQVSVKAAQTLMQRLKDRCGAINATAIANAQLDQMGMPGKRVQTMQYFASQVEQKKLNLDQNWSQLRGQLLALPGIGPWTCDYLGIRMGRDEDAFPASDLGLIRSAGAETTRELLKQAESWQPYRAYAACYLWAGHQTQP